MSTESFNLGDLYAAAADEIEHRQYCNFGAGRDTWSSVHFVVQTLVTKPLIEGVRRKLGIAQVQHWDADKETVIKTLRDLSGSSEQLDVLKEANAAHWASEATKILRDAFGYPDEDYAREFQIAQWAADRLRLLEAENAQLKADLQARKDVA